MTSLSMTVRYKLNCSHLIVSSLRLLFLLVSTYPCFSLCKKIIMIQNVCGLVMRFAALYFKQEQFHRQPIRIMNLDLVIHKVISFPQVLVRNKKTFHECVYTNCGKHLTQNTWKYPGFQIAHFLYYSIMIYLRLSHCVCNVHHRNSVHLLRFLKNHYVLPVSVPAFL